MKSIVILLIQIKLKLQLTKDVLKAEYSNSVIFLKSIIMTKEDDAMNLNAITQLWNSLKKNLLKWSV